MSGSTARLPVWYYSASHTPVRRERRGAGSFRAALPRGTDTGSRYPPPLPPTPTEAMMHDPRRYGVAAPEPARGYLVWWV
eukprot:6086530-Prymnesium_polylepis.1